MFLYDPLYKWSMDPIRALKKQAEVRRPPSHPNPDIPCAESCPVPMASGAGPQQHTQLFTLPPPEPPGTTPVAPQSQPPSIPRRPPHVALQVPPPVPLHEGYVTRSATGVYQNCPNCTEVFGRQGTHRSKNVVQDKIDVDNWKALPPTKHFLQF